MKEREGLNSKNEKLSQKGDKAKQGLREIPFLGES